MTAFIVIKFDQDTLTKVVDLRVSVADEDVKEDELIARDALMEDLIAYLTEDETPDDVTNIYLN